MKSCALKRSGVKGASALKRELWRPGTVIGVRNLNVPGEIWSEFVEATSEWMKYANVQFDYSGGNNWVRVEWSDGAGSSSALGRECLSFDPAAPTMTLGWRDLAMYKHEMGHVLGLEHVTLAQNFPYHFKIAETIKWFHDQYGWRPEQIYREVINKSGGVIESEWTQRQIMGYYFPASLIEEGVEIVPGDAISESEKQLVSMLYPRI